MRILITGGAGFIGSHLVDEGLRRGHDLVVVDDLSRGKLENLSHCLSRIQFVKGDVRDQGLMMEALRGVDVVFHLAALASAPESIALPRLSAEINDLGTLTVFQCAAENRIRRLVYASSAVVYGDAGDIFLTEDLKPAPGNPYAAHKLLGEHYGTIFERLYGLDVVSLRYFNVYGPRQDSSSPYSGVISIFLDRIAAGEPVLVHGRGEQSRDFIFVEDVVCCSYLAASAENLKHKILNVGGGGRVTLNRLVSVLAEVTGREVGVEYTQPRKGDIISSSADTSLAAEELGFKAFFPLTEGLALTWAEKGTHEKQDSE